MKRLVNLSIVAIVAAASLAGIAGFAASGHSSEAAIKETTGPSVGYETVSAALADLRTRPSVIFTTENGWQIATDVAAKSIWSFAPKGYPAYPAVVKRQAESRGSGSLITMSVLCEASKGACDDLVRMFAQMNSLPVPK